MIVDETGEVQHSIEDFPKNNCFQNSKDSMLRNSIFVDGFYYIPIKKLLATFIIKKGKNSRILQKFLKKRSIFIGPFQEINLDACITDNWISVRPWESNMFIKHINLINKRGYS